MLIFTFLLNYKLVYIFPLIIKISMRLKLSIKNLSMRSYSVLYFVLTFPAKPFFLLIPFLFPFSFSSSTRFLYLCRFILQGYDW